MVTGRVGPFDGRQEDGMTDRSGQEVTAALIAAVNAHDLDGIVDQFSGVRPKRDSGPSGAQLRRQRSGPPQLGADPRSGQRPARRGPLVDDYHGYHDRPRDGLAGARVRWPAARRRAVADAGRDGQRGRRWTDRRPPLLYGAGRDRRFRRRRSRSTDHDAGPTRRQHRSARRRHRPPRERRDDPRRRWNGPPRSAGRGAARLA